MAKKKNTNFILVITAVILGVVLFKDTNFLQFKFAHPAPDILYPTVFIVVIFLLVRK